MKTRYYDVHLPYFKKGDDLAGCREGAMSDALAFLRHALKMETSAHILRVVAKLAQRGLLIISDAGTHVIQVRCEQEAGDRLVKEGFFGRGSHLEDFEGLLADEEDDAARDVRPLRGKTKRMEKRFLAETKAKTRKPSTH